MEEKTKSEQLWEIRIKLDSIGYLLKQQAPDSCYTNGELYGIGVILCELSKTLFKLEQSSFSYSKQETTNHLP